MDPVVSRSRHRRWNLVWCPWRMALLGWSGVNQQKIWPQQVSGPGHVSWVPSGSRASSKEGREPLDSFELSDGV